MRRGLAWLAGALGLVALLRLLRREQLARSDDLDPADELRAKLEHARTAPDDRDEFDAAEGQPVDEIERPRSLDERRRAVHEKAQQALGEMRLPDADD